MKFLKSLSAAAVAALALGGPTAIVIGGPAAQAQDYPNSRVTMVVPYSPGGGTDILGRIVAQQLSEIWGQPVNVENKPGASGAVGAAYTMQQAADGYTIMMGSTGTILSLARKAAADGEAGDFDVAGKLAPISLVAAPPYLLVVNAEKVQAKTVAEFVALAKAHPDDIAYGSSGRGSASHLTGALFERMAGVDLLHVPYSGTGPAVTDLLSGQISAMFAPAPVVLPHVEAGTLTPIALTGAKPSKLLPDYPTIAQSGVAGFDSVGWFGLFAPKGTPDAIVEKISQDLLQALASDAVQEKMGAQGAEPEGMAPEAYRAWVNKDIKQWLDIEKAAD
jgi:tripartite-type tricarboxylate transporter receptor subunit TctC